MTICSVRTLSGRSAITKRRCSIAIGCHWGCSWELHAIYRWATICWADNRQKGRSRHSVAYVADLKSGRARAVSDKGGDGLGDWRLHHSDNGRDNTRANRSVDTGGCSISSESNREGGRKLHFGYEIAVND